MLTVAEAQALVLQHAHALAPVRVSLSASTLGLILAEDVFSDIDMPPWDKAMMDGYALRTADLPGGCGSLHVIEEVTAGQVPRRAVAAGQATRIMTGAPLPSGADAVVQMERTQAMDAEKVRIEDPRLKPGQHILPRGQELSAGAVALRRGARLRPQELGVLASVGRTGALVVPAPTVVVVATGDEIVEAPQLPGPGQIRNGNGPMLMALAARANSVPRYLGIGHDTVNHLRQLIGDGLQSSVLLLSGGVSAGKLDLVPGVLQELGVKPHFHHVAMKPGKPVFFGTRGDTLVFGLPGNPVSAYVCFELFARPAIRLLRGLADAGTVLSVAPLAVDHAYRTDRPTYHPANLETTDQGWRVRPVPWFGSPDLRGLTDCDCFVLLPAGDHQHRAGQLFPVLSVDERD
jgi:molybdopterin molybdotransferase